MGYLSVWKVLEEAVAVLRRKGVVAPEKVMDDLRSARTLIRILEAGSNHEETAQKVETYLTNVESFLVSSAEKQFGSEYADHLLKRLGEAGRRIGTEETEEEKRFVPGLPREYKWIRIKPSADLSIERLKALIEGLELSFRMQSDGCLLVYGKDEHLKDFVKKMTANYASKTEKPVNGT
jgi:hypothetical protein